MGSQKTMSTPCKDYDFDAIELNWQKFWKENGTFEAENFSDKPKYYMLDMLPYPSGAGLHIGHPIGYTASDIVARYKKATGHNVLHPMGWDAFGLPAEQHAIATGTPPAENTASNIERFRKQLQRIGFGIDWSREVNTTDPEFYKWTQTLFLKLFEHGLAYVDEKPVWWCPALGTALANEEVIDGKSERGDHPVERRNLRQWVLRITAYADKLLDGLEELDWPSSTKRQQTAWIGRSQGVNIFFGLEDFPEEQLEIYTARPDTIYGTSFITLAPEHRLVSKLTKPDRFKEVEIYLEKSKQKSDLARTDLAKEKTGVFTGSYAINPVTGDKMPVWVADYVLINYGTGAVMGVPDNDDRDFEFAKIYDISIPKVIKQKDDPTEDGSQTVAPYHGYGVLLNSGPYTGMTSEDAIPKVIEDMEANKHGKASVNYKLRDWLFSRQRYWGEPFPILWIEEADYNKLKNYPNSPLLEHAPKTPVTYHKDDKTLIAVGLGMTNLPLELPQVSSYEPSDSAESPLATATDWVDVAINLETGETCQKDQAPNEEAWVFARRETNTMPQWAGSCWYYLRYLDPTNTERFIDEKIEQYWQGPDWYIGGAEHAVLHLLYARFWHQFLYDIGLLTTKEPFKKLFHQGLLLGEDGNKMSKSKGNTVDPLHVIEKYGADTLRVYLMFLGPLGDSKPWNSQGIEGSSRFLKKTWRLLIDEEGKLSPKIKEDFTDSKDTLQLLHQTIQKVTADIESLGFNTAISQMMILLSHLQKQEHISKQTAQSFVQLLAPFAPHITEEIWARMGHSQSITDAPWPKHDPAMLAKDEVNLVLQVNGRMRGEVKVAKDLSQQDALALAKAHPRVVPHLEGKNIVKEIYVPGRIVNLVAK